MLFRSLSLGFRISANSSSGHLLVHMIISSGSSDRLRALFCLFVLICLFVMEYSVSLIQVIVYSVLTWTYAVT